MSDLFDTLSDKFQQLSSRVAKDGKKYIQSAVSKGEKIGQKGKIQLEIEKLKWELKQKYADLGKYVTDKKESKSVTDFSHDSHFLELVNEAYQLKNYLEERRVQNRQKIKK